MKLAWKTARTGRKKRIASPARRGTWSVLLAASIALLGAGPASAGRLEQKTVQAFEQYVRQTEARLGQRLNGGKPFLWVDSNAGKRQRVRGGEIVIEPWNAGREVEIPEGLIHDWVGSVFIPNTTLQQTLALVQDYDRHKQIYRPEVIESKIVSRNGNEFRVHLRLLKKKMITVVLDTEHHVTYFPLDENRWHSRSYTTRVAELENPGEPDEKALPPGSGHGFLWALNSYWRFQQADGGVYVECQAVSLTRDMPTGLGWLIDPIVKNLPRESLENTLKATRTALAR